MVAVPYIQRAVEAAANALMDAEATAQTNAPYYQRSGTRTAYRNGYRTRHWHTPIGELTLHIPKLRQGTYYPAFLEQDTAAEQLADLAWQALAGEPDADTLRSLLSNPDDEETLAHVLAILCEIATDHLSRRLHSPYPRLTVTQGDDGSRLFYGERADGSRHLLDAHPNDTDRQPWETVAETLRERGLHGVRKLDGDGLTPDIRKALWRAFPAAARNQQITAALGTPLPTPTYRDGSPRMLLTHTADASLDTRISTAHLHAVYRMMRRKGDAIGVILTDIV